MEKKKCLDFSVKGPVPVFLEEDRTDQRSGCSVLDVSFPEPVTIGEILFRNYYTAYISISCKRVPADKDVKNRDTLLWQTSIKHLVLMPDPHCEQGSQDMVSVASKQSALPWLGVVCLRFVLKQPSSHWRKFGIEDLTVYKDAVKDQKQAGFVQRAFATEKMEKKVWKQENLASKDVVASTDVAANLQNLKQITELMKSKQTGAVVGRFEVDGSYDVSHLI